MEKLTFDELKKLISSIPVNPIGNNGAFDLKINNANRRYILLRLKETATNNPDNCGFSLNHYESRGLPMPRYKTSRFLSDGNVNVTIWRNEFNYAYKVENFNEIGIVMKTWSAQVNWK